MFRSHRRANKIRQKLGGETTCGERGSQRASSASPAPPEAGPTGTECVQETASWCRAGVCEISEPLETEGEDARKRKNQYRMGVPERQEGKVMRGIRYISEEILTANVLNLTKKQPTATKISINSNQDKHTHARTHAFGHLIIKQMKKIKRKMSTRQRDLLIWA